MDVKTVCLGMLTDGEASGYDLKKKFESSFGHFFAAGYGSIYTALDDPAPSHKTRSEFLATICFAHLMTPRQIETVLGSRIEEIEAYFEMFDEFENTCMQDWPKGMVFTVGLARAVMNAMKQYIEDNGQALVEGPVEDRRAASGS